MYKNIYVQLMKHLPIRLNTKYYNNILINTFWTYVSREYNENTDDRIRFGKGKNNRAELLETCAYLLTAKKNILFTFK